MLAGYERNGQTAKGVSVQANWDKDDISTQQQLFSNKKKQTLETFLICVDISLIYLNMVSGPSQEQIRGRLLE